MACCLEMGYALVKCLLRPCAPLFDSMQRTWKTVSRICGPTFRFCKDFTRIVCRPKIVLTFGLLFMALCQFYLSLSIWNAVEEMHTGFASMTDKSAEIYRVKALNLWSPVVVMIPTGEGSCKLIRDRDAKLQQGALGKCIIHNMTKPKHPLPKAEMAQLFAQPPTTTTEKLTTTTAMKTTTTEAETTTTEAEEAEPEAGVPAGRPAPGVTEDEQPMEQRSRLRLLADKKAKTKKGDASAVEAKTKKGPVEEAEQWVINHTKAFTSCSWKDAYAGLVNVNSTQTGVTVQTQCTQELNFGQLRWADRYFSMMMVGMSWRGTCSMAMPSADMSVMKNQRDTKKTLIWQRLIIVMGAKYFNRFFALLHTVWQVPVPWYNMEARTRYDRQLETWLLCGAASVFILVLQIILSLTYVVLWRNGHYLTPNISIMGLRVCFQSLLALLVANEVEKKFGWFRRMAQSWITLFWLGFSLWAFLVTIPMIATAAFYLQFEWHTFHCGWIFEDDIVFNDAYAKAGNKCMIYTMIAVILFIAETMISLKIDSISGRAKAQPKVPAFKLPEGEYHKVFETELNPDPAQA